MMVLKILVFVLYVYCNVAPSEAEAAYDLIIIPVPKAAPVRTKKHQLNYPKRNQYISNINNRNRKDDFLKLDIENYQEPTDMPDIDDLDFNNEKEESGFDTYGNYGEDKIVGGVEVDINLYPYHVAYGTNCGGAIIDKKWVITAGHCGKKPFIRVGSKYLNQGRKVDVKSYHVHPMWSAKNKEHPFDYDFQLLELKEPLKFDSNIQPVKIAHIEDMVIGKVITVTGWGNTEENGPYSTVLRAVRVPIISKENCQSVPFPYFRGGLTARMFCAGFSEGKKDACQGDSGGPAVAYDRILGMVSFGYGCATPGSYGVYSKVAKVRPWVEEVTGIKFEYILGGYNISIFKAPYQVNYGDICGGVLIHRLWSMTSAHCGTELYIRVGHNHRLYGSKIRIHSHVVHPKYMQDHTFDYDLQLLRHNRRLHFTLRVSAVRISYGNRGNSVVVSGWGYPKEKGDYTDVLQRVNLEIVPLDVCQSIEKPWYNHTLTDRMFCAGGAGKDACQGDSGGGAISRGKLIGISSFGYGCGRNIPGVYTNVTEEFIRKWIHFYTGV